MNIKSRYLKWIRKNSIKGFTLVELLVVLAVIAVLASGVIYTTIGQADKAKDAKTLSSIKEIKNGLDLYYQDTDCYPTNDNFLSGTSWKVTNNGKETVYIAKMPTGASSFEYKTDTVSACPQWGIVYAPLLKSQTNSVCKIPSYVANEPSCVPPQYSSSWGCVILGKIQCGTAPAPVPTTIIPAPTSTNPVPTPTPQTGGTTNLVEDSDHDGYYIGGASPQVIDSTPSSYNGRQYYRKKDGSTGYIYISPTATGMLGGGDCDDSNANLFTNLSSSVTDADHDGYYLGTTSLTNCVGASATYPMTGGLVGSYSMDAGTGTTVSDSSGFNNTAKFGSTFGLVGWWKLSGVTDSSGNNLPITYGTGTPSTGPMYGANSTSALTFNGSSDYIYIPHNNLFNPTRQITISGWYKLNSLHTPYSWHQLFFKGDLPDWTPSTAVNRQYGMWLRNDGTLYAAAMSATGTAQTDCYGVVGAISANSWSYIALVINSDAGTMNIYVNGQLQNSCAFATTGIKTTTGNLYFGANPSWGAYFNGSMADLRIYNRALSVYELQQMYSTATGGLAGYWQFDEARGNVAYDSSGNGNNGAMNHRLLTWLKFDEGAGAIAYDSSGNGYNATSSNTVWEPNAIRFNGSNSYATAPGASNVAGDSPWTISLWAYTLANPPSWSTMIALGEGGTSGRSPVIYRGSGGGYAMGFYNGTVTGPVTALNRWDHITVTYTGGNGTISTYLNGAFYSSAPASTYGPSTTTGDTITIGRDYWGNSSFFNGYMDNLQIYAKALNASEVQNLFANASGGPRYTQPGRVGVAAGNFNPGTAINSGNYASLGTGSTLNLPGEMSAFMWVRPRDVNSLGALLGQVDGAGNGGNFNFNLGLRTPGEPGRIEANWGGVVNKSTTALANNQWYHIGFVRSGSAGNWTGKIYINGVLDKTFTNNVAPQAQLPTVLGGLGANFPTWSFNGNIDEVQLYNRALTQSEITAIYNNTGSPFWDTDRDNVAAKALNFNGVSSIVGAPDSSSLKLGNKQTVTAWVKWNGWGATSSVQRIVGKGYYNRNYSLWVYPGTGSMLYQIYDVNTGAHCPLFSTTGLGTGTWNFIAGVYDGTTMKLYTNNVLNGSLACTIAPTDNDPLNIGGWGSGSPANSFNGLIDSVNIYKRVLSQAELSELFISTIPGKVANWKMDETTGTTIKDSVGNLNATIGSMNSFQPGKIGNALYNPGTSAGATLQTSGTSAIDFTSSSTPTIAFWLKGGSSLTVGRLIEQPSVGGWGVEYVYGLLRLISYGAPSNCCAEWAGVVPSDNAWHHYAITYSSGTARLYKDGALVSALPFTPQWTSAARTFYLGGDASYPLSGYLDEVQIYNRPLTAAEVSVLATQSPAGGISKLYYRNNSGSYTFVKQDEVIAPNDTNDNDPLVW